MAEQSNSEYHAFLSYAHEDADTVGWLDEVLSNYWVPGARSRRIYRDRRRVTARSLDDQIQEALKFSKFLIVCWSKDAADSTWVPKEIDFFLRSHPDALAEGRILVCQVGASEDPDISLPPPLDSALRTSFFIPDLRGRPVAARGKEKRHFVEEALALLAVLVGLGDKEEVLRRRQRQQIFALSLAGTLLLTALLAFMGWRLWLATPEGLFHQNLARLLAAVEGNEISHTSLFSTAEALGRLDRRELVDEVSRLFPESSMKALFQAVGYASLPQPDCPAAEQKLALLDTSAYHSWPAPLLVIARPCGEEWIDRALPPPDGPDDAVRSAILLAEHGYIDRAQTLSQRSDFPASEILPLKVTLAASRRDKAARVPDSTLESWGQDKDSHDRLYYMMEFFQQLDDASLMKSPLASQLLDLAVRAAEELPDKPSVSWYLKQKLAAYLALASRKDEAERILSQTSPGQWADFEERQLEDEAVGWAWRGFAYFELEQWDTAEQAFGNAQYAASKPYEASRTWEEWFDLVFIYTKIGDWSRASSAAEGPREERVRVRLRCRLIELWADERLPSHNS